MLRLIAEAATIHGGDLENALECVRVAKDAGADTVKFQHVDPEHFPPGEMRDWYAKARFTIEQWRIIEAYGREKEIQFLCTPQTIVDFEDLLEVGIGEVKISADNSANEALLARVAFSHCRVFISVMTPHAVPGAVNILTNRGKSLRDIKTLHTTPEYPCPPENTNLKWLKEIDGFSDHTVGSQAGCMAIALGATIIEKHFRLTEFDDGPDVGPWACYPDDLESYFNDIKTAERMMG